MSTFFDIEGAGQNYTRTDTEVVNEAVVSVKATAMHQHYTNTGSGASSAEMNRYAISSSYAPMQINVNEVVCVYTSEKDRDASSRVFTHQTHTAQDKVLRGARMHEDMPMVFSSLSGMPKHRKIRPVGVARTTAEANMKDAASMLVSVGIQGTYSIRHTGQSLVKQGDMVFIRKPTDTEAARQKNSTVVGNRVVPVTESIRGFWRAGLHSPSFIPRLYSNGSIRNTLVRGSGDDDDDEKETDVRRSQDPLILYILNEIKDDTLADLETLDILVNEIIQDATPEEALAVLKERDGADEREVKESHFTFPDATYDPTMHDESGRSKMHRVVMLGNAWIHRIYNPPAGTTKAFEPQLALHTLAIVSDAIQEVRRSFSSNLLGVALNNCKSNDILDVFVGRCDSMAILDAW